MLTDEGTPTFQRTDWMADGNCKNQDPEIFFIEGKYVVGSAAYRNALAKARSFCTGCPVRKPCYEYGMSQPAGVWAGTTASQRRSRKRVNIITIVEGKVE
jgi:WhiB family redox-sensing transcriptional regulator